MTGFQNIEQGFNLTNCLLQAINKKPREKAKLIYYLSFIYYFIVTYSANGPNVSTGKKRQGCNNQDNHKCHQSEG
jgi:hypothetical protein